MNEVSAEFQQQRIQELVKKMEFGSKKIPTYIFDPHNLAFYCWAEGLKQGKIEKGANLIHIDTHFDGSYPLDNNYQKLDLNDLSEVAKITNKLSILDFIAPAVALDLVSNVVWVSPRKFDEKPFEYAIVVPHEEETIETPSFKSILKSLNNPKKVIVDVDIDYFMHGNTAERDFEQVREVMNKAGLITIATSSKPLHDQEQAHRWVKTLLTPSSQVAT